MTGQATPHGRKELALELRVTGQTPERLELHYQVENRADSDVYLFNRLYRQQLPGGGAAVETDLVYTSLAGGRLRLAKWVPEIPENILVEYPIIPCATLLERGRSFQETFRVALPAVSHHAYHPPRLRLPGERPVIYQSLTFALGYFKTAEMGGRQVSRVKTTAGDAFYVPVTAPDQRVVTSDMISRAVPVLPDFPVEAPRTCPRCGATNTGSQPACLFCQSPLPPPSVAVAPTERRCPQCGRVVPPGNAFCTRDGTPVP
jgi:hypothetical protein